MLGGRSGGADAGSGAGAGGDVVTAGVAHLVGYASPSAFIAAFAREYGHTPGRHRAASGPRGNPAPARARRGPRLGVQ
ncbi:hypothetical protein RM780_24675 [Streptomyces sp. DSM 44917]|uniref:HTH araC/xylS-type domain-containing protein n=1 Tax=Streptomyces boetiae TaxID=3075541 RepID=A0ABU2LEV5_9ACTN|nr:hypothetical protein [Streptomyces sp. DSM 44917]MDT0310124.1 hypothetical protein [Streptomyces sp. DSM 44917]